MFSFAFNLQRLKQNQIWQSAFWMNKTKVSFPEHLWLVEQNHFALQVS